MSLTVLSESRARTNSFAIREVSPTPFFKAFKELHGPCRNFSYDLLF